MRKQRPTEEIRQDLALARLNLWLAKRRLEETQRQLQSANEAFKVAKSKLEEYTGSWNRQGILQRLQWELQEAENRDQWDTMHAVRVSGYSSDFSRFGFVKLTAKLIFVRRGPGHRDERYPHAKVHPDDLALIRAGQADRLPLVSEVAE